MKRNCSLDEISDGRRYDFNDLAEVSCNGCKGAAACCHGMGNTIILDPYDVYLLSAGLNCTFEGLLADKLELNIVDGIILPNLKMAGSSEACTFLNADGKCSVHAFRPGICRIFPLGRCYENGDYKYFLQNGECSNPAKTKIRVSKWIDTPDPDKKRRFLIQWHYFLNAGEAIIKNTQDERLIKDLNMYLLKSFYVRQYTADLGFYVQFDERLTEAEGILKSLGR